MTAHMGLLRATQGSSRLAQVLSGGVLEFRLLVDSLSRSALARQFFLLSIQLGISLKFNQSNETEP